MASFGDSYVLRALATAVRAEEFFGFDEGSGVFQCVYNAADKVRRCEGFDQKFIYAHIPCCGDLNFPAVACNHDNRDERIGGDRVFADHVH